MNANEIKMHLAESVAKNSNVLGIGQTGDVNAPLVPGFSDIDIFVLCNEIPTVKERKVMYEAYKEEYSECLFNVSNGGLWGYGDILVAEGIEIMFMYFLEDEMKSYIDSVLSGKDTDKHQDGFYPTGRVASVETITILYEENNTYSQLIDRINNGSESLFQKMFEMYSQRILNDEDLGRAMLRKDVLFYHMVLEIALDNFLQALFALNHTFFPSRKRMEKYIKGFQYKPENCYRRLLSMIQDSVNENTILKSVDELKELTSELLELKNK